VRIWPSKAAESDLLLNFTVNFVNFVNVGARARETR